MLRAARRHGFTLIEVLVAVVIVAILASLVTIGLSGLGGDRELAREAQRLKSHLDFACELAVLNGRSIGLVQSADGGYRFLQRRLQRWQVLDEPPALAPHRLPAQVRLELRREGRALSYRPPDDAALAPQVACLASGEMTPFTARLDAVGAEQRWIITGAIDAQTRIEHAPRLP